jgi:hypothetical protein
MLVKLEQLQNEAIAGATSLDEMMHEAERDHRKIPMTQVGLHQIVMTLRCAVRDALIHWAVDTNIGPRRPDESMSDYDERLHKVVATPWVDVANPLANLHLKTWDDLGRCYTCGKLLQPVPLTVSDALTVPDVRALVESIRQEHEEGRAWECPGCPVCEALDPFLAALDAEKEAG